MNYIECSHCGKQYEITEKILASEGQFVTCTSCKQEFLIVINRGDEVEEAPQKAAEPASKGVWDPTLTMPEPEEAGEAPVREQVLEGDDDGANVLARLKSEKKKKTTMIILAGILLLAIAAAAFFMMKKEDIAPTSTVATVAKEKTVQISPRAQDENNPVCRQEAAKKWMIDTQAMHGDYSGEEFVRILKRSETQKEAVLTQCKQENIIKDIIAAATAREVPSWIAAEIEVLQANRSR